jgi:hypothetical protein
MDTDLKQILKGYDTTEYSDCEDYCVRNLSKRYLEQYWLDIGEFSSFWLPIKNKIFNPFSKDLPELMFNEGFELVAQKAGILFTKEEYHALQKCMKSAGDEYFVIIENKTARNTITDYHPFRFKFSIGTTWKELNNGDETDFSDISSYDLLLNPQKHFFVFGNSGRWGKYTANDYNDTPLDIIGFKPELASDFKEQFKQQEDEQDEIWEWLPHEYKKLINKNY